MGRDVEASTHSNTIVLEGSVSVSIYSIYKATNTINGKVYIGFDSHWPKRKREHLREVVKGSSLVFHNALREYGPDAFEWEVVCQSKNGQHLLNEMEPYFIKHYNSFYRGGQGYNMTLGGDGCIGHRHSPETLAKMSAVRTGKKLPPRTQQYRDAMSIIKRGIKQSPQTIAKRVAANTGKKRSKETRELMSSSAKKRSTLEYRAKLSLAHTGKKMSPGACAKNAAARLGKKQSPETIAKRALANKGKKRSPETCARISAGNKGKRQSPEHIAKLSSVRRGKRQSPETIKKRTESWKKNWENKRNLCQTDICQIQI